MAIKDNPFLDAFFLEQTESKASSLTDDVQQTAVHFKPLSSTERNRLPGEVIRQLGDKSWALVPREFYNSVRYRRDVLIWVKSGKDWEKVSFSQLSSYSESLVLAPVTSDAPSARTGTIRTGTAGFPGTQFSKTKSLEETITGGIDTAVRILSPGHGARIHLMQCDHTRRWFVEHRMTAGETPESIAERYLGIASAGLVYGFNEQYDPDNPPSEGSVLMMPNGWDLEVTGSVSNSDTVTLQWQGPVSGSKTIEAEQGHAHLLADWWTRLELPPGDYQLTARAGAAEHRINVTLLSVTDFVVEVKGQTGLPLYGSQVEVEFAGVARRTAFINKHGLHVFREVPKGEVSIRYPKPEAVEATVLAADIRKAFDEYDEQALYRAINQTPELVQQIIRAYNKHYNTLSGKGLLADIEDRFNPQEDHKAIWGLLAALEVNTGKGHQYFAPEDTTDTIFKVQATPALSSVIEGHDFSLRLHQQQDTIASTDAYATYQWFVVYDPAAVAHQGAPAIEILDDEIETSSDKLTRYRGQHIAICCYQFHHGNGQANPFEYYSYPYYVGDAVSLLANDMAQVESHLENPDVALAAEERYIQTLEQVAAGGPMDKAAREQHEAQLEQLKDNNQRLAELLEDSQGKTRYPIKALAQPKDGGEPIPLKLFCFKKDSGFFGGETWGLIDWTWCGNTAFCGEYEGSGDNPTEAIKEALKDFEANSQLPASSISYQIDFIHEQQRIQLSGALSTHGESTFDSFIKWSGYVALGAAGVALLFSPIPGSRVASAAIWSSIVTSTAASSLSIYQRWDKGFSNLKDDGLDVLGIVGNCFAAGWIRHAAKLNFAGKQGVKAGSYMLYGQVGTDAASGVILTTEAYEQIEAVKQNPKLTAQQKINQIGEIVRSAAIAGALTTLSLKGSKADLKQLKHGNIDIKPQTLEHKTHTDQQKHQVTVKQEVVGKAEIQSYTPHPKAAEKGPKAGNRIYKRLHRDGIENDPYTLMPDGKPMGAEAGTMPKEFKGMAKLPLNYEQFKEAGWPDLNRPNWQGEPAEDFANFLDAKPVELRPGQKIYRIIDELNYDAGAYWAYELPRNKTEWRRDYAVKDSWNDNGYYIEYTVKEGESIKVWEGKAAGQAYLDGKYYLPGGGIQLYIEPGTIETPAPKLTNWSD